MVDSIDEICENSQSILTLNLLPLANLRKVPVAPKEAYSITWKKDGVLLPGFANKTRIQVAGDNAVGEYAVDVDFQTEEIRLKTSRTQTSASHVVKGVCD